MSHIFTKLKILKYPILAVVVVVVVVAVVVVHSVIAANCRGVTWVSPNCTRPNTRAPVIRLGMRNSSSAVPNSSNRLNRGNNHYKNYHKKNSYQNSDWTAHSFARVLRPARLRNDDDVDRTGWRRFWQFVLTISYFFLVGGRKLGKKVIFK